jgi:hypothetical protein
MVEGQDQVCKDHPGLRQSAHLEVVRQDQDSGKDNRQQEAMHLDLVKSACLQSLLLVSKDPADQCSSSNMEHHLLSNNKEAPHLFDRLCLPCRLSNSKRHRHIGLSHQDWEQDLLRKQLVLLQSSLQQSTPLAIAVTFPIQQSQLSQP